MSVPFVLKCLKLLAFVSVCYSQTTEIPSTVSYGCIESPTDLISGNYSEYDTWGDHSIWIQHSEVDAFVISFETELTEIYEKAFAMYRCDTPETYTSQVENMQDKSPKNIMGCAGTPQLFCPTLEADDATSLIDGMSATDGNLNFIDIATFYECEYWFVYDDQLNYPTRSSLTFAQNEYCETESSTSSGESGSNGVVAPGQKTSTAKDESETPKMSATAQAVLWSVVSVFVLVCIVAVSYFVYQWRQNKLKEMRSEPRMALTAQKEEDKFEKAGQPTHQEQVATPLVDEEPPLALA